MNTTLGQMIIYAHKVVKDDAKLKKAMSFFDQLLKNLHPDGIIILRRWVDCDGFIEVIIEVEVEKIGKVRKLTSINPVYLWEFQDELESV